MNKKIGLFYISCLYILIAIGMGGCVGYAGSVGPSGGGANKSTPGTVAATPGSVNFGSVAIGSTSSQSVSLTNPSRAAVVISNLTSSSAAFVPSGLTFPLNLAPGQSTAFHVAFQPRTAGDFSGTIAVANDANSSATLIGVSGSGTQNQQPGVVAASTANLSLGSVVVGSAGTQSFSVTNTGGMTAVLSSVSSSSASFSASGPTFPMNINPGQTVPFTVTFTPTAAGDASGVITVGSNASNAPTTVAVSGTGTAAATAGALSANPASVSIGNVNVGSTGSQSFSVTNTGGTTVKISSISSSAATFTASGPTLPMSLAAGQSVSVKVAFAPTAAGNANGTITLASDASNAPTSVAVSATGVTPATAPTISSQPTNQTVVAGQTATFSVTASGVGPLTYQWKKSGTAISGATSASYTTAATTSADNGASFTVAVSNSAGSVTSSAASLTVTTATLSLSANPTSLSFGSVNVGSNSSQSVTFTNNGNSDVTVSNVSVSGAGFNATGVSAGQVVAAGKTASLSVTFAPSGSGSLTGSVTVTSNAANSPLTVALSGTGASVAPPAVSGAPTCGKNNDTAIEMPSDWSTFVPPAKGQSYVDSSFGCTVTRITDSSTEDWGGSFYLPINHGYATVSPFNVNDSYLMLADGWNRHFVTDLTGNIVVPLTNMPAANDTWMLWDTTSPNVFYYTQGNSLMKGTISGSSVTTSTIHQFSEYAAINFMDETDVSQDGEHVVIVGGDTSGSSVENIFDYDFVTGVKSAVYTTQCAASVDSPNNGCLHKLIQTPDNNVIIQFANDGSGIEQGNRLWTGGLLTDLLSLTPTDLLPLQNATNHLDAGSDMNGNPVFVEIGNNSVLPGETNPCPSGWGTDVRQIYTPTSANCLIDIDKYGNLSNEHVSYRGNSSQPWVGLSFFDNRTPSPEWFANSSNYVAPSSSNWQYLEDEIDVVRIDANNDSQYAYRLAHAYSRSDEDFYANPRAAISRDGRYVAFDSNMAYARTGCPATSQNTTGCTDVYIIKVR